MGEWAPTGMDWAGRWEVEDDCGNIWSEPEWPSRLCEWVLIWETRREFIRVGRAGDIALRVGAALRGGGTYGGKGMPEVRYRSFGDSYGSSWGSSDGVVGRELSTVDVELEGSCKGGRVGGGTVDLTGLG